MPVTAPGVRKPSEIAFTFAVRPMDFSSVCRTLQLRGDQSLADLQRVIEAELALPSDRYWRFFLSGELCDSWSARGDDEAQDPIDSLGIEPRTRIAHQVGIGDDQWCQRIDVLHVGPADTSATYPVVLERSGAIPVQSGGGTRGARAAAPDTLSSGFVSRIARAARSQQEGGSRPGGEALRASLAALEEAFEACRSPRDLERLGERVGIPLGLWASDVAFRLGEEGRFADGAELLARLAKALGHAPFPPALLAGMIEAMLDWGRGKFEWEFTLPPTRLAELARSVIATQRVNQLSAVLWQHVAEWLAGAVRVLVEGGEVAAARDVAVHLAGEGASPGWLVRFAELAAEAGHHEAARTTLSEVDERPWAMTHYEAVMMARVHAAVGDDAAAEARARSIAARRWIDSAERGAAVALLIEILERSGRAEAARAAAAEHAEWCRQRNEAREERVPRRHGGTGLRSAPRVGRNEPCPCGSGKKFKKCCARASS